MKKILLFFSAVLVSLAAGASITTQEWTFTNMDAWDGTTTASFNSETGVVTANAWRGVGNWGEISTAEFDMLIVEISDHANAVQVKIKSINNDEDSQVEAYYLATESTIAVNQNCVALDLSSAKEKLKWIELNNASDVNGATFKIKRIYALKNTGVEITRPLWSGNNAFGHWLNSISVDPFARVYEWDEMVITYTKENDPQCQIKIRGTEAFLDFVGDYVDVSGETQASFLLSAADVAAIKSNGFYLNGKNMTITAVRIVSHRTLASEEKVVGGWNNYCEINAGMLADLQIGNNICVRVTNIASGEYQRVSLYNGWSNSDLLVGCEHFFGGETASGESPLIVRFPVTGSMKQQLGSRNLLVRGCYFTMTDVYVEEGTPVAESGVKGYLTVSTARMATFVLPFNVQTLPAGVQAYDLTYDGSNVILATEVNSLTADQPVLIIAAAGEYTFNGDDGSSADISGKTGTYANGALIGTYQTIDQLAENDGAGNNNYILSNGTDGVAFYQVLDNTCSVAPYRAYLSCGHNANPGGATPAPMRIVFRQQTPTDMEALTVEGQQPTAEKVLLDGKLFIIRNGVMYNVNGQIIQ